MFYTRHLTWCYEQYNEWRLESRWLLSMLFIVLGSASLGYQSKPASFNKT